MSVNPAEIADLKRRNPIRKAAEACGAVFTRGRNYGDCPLCGDGRKGQTRFEVFPRDERWACAACAQGGDVIALVGAKYGLDFPGAVARLGGITRLDPEEARRIEARQAEKRARADAERLKYRERMRRSNFAIWQAALPLTGTATEGYLRARGIAFRLGDLALRHVDELAFLDGEEIDAAGRSVPRVIHRGPAMLAAFVDAGGRFMSLHRTWIDLGNPPKFRPALLDREGKPLLAKKMLGHKQGGYLKLCEGASRRVIRVGEGIETTLSVREAMRDDACYRAAGDLGNMVGPARESLRYDDGGRQRWAPGPEPDVSGEAMPVPDECEALTLLEDGDTQPFVLTHARARGLARFAKPGRRVCWAPSGQGRDFNGWLMEAGA